MPAKQVTQYDCDRCGRVWYVEQGENSLKSPELDLKFKSPGSDAPLEIKYDCLCDGCKKTVTALVESLGKTTKKSPPAGRAKKKKEGSATGTDAEAATKTTSASSGTSPTPATPPVAPPASPSPAAGSGTGAAAKPAGAAASASSAHRTPTRQ